MKWLMMPLLLTLLVQASACTYVTAVSQTNVPKQRDKPVRAETKRYIILGFNFDNDYPYLLVQKLQEQCPKGQVRGLMTKDTLTMYFLVFFWSREQKAEGYCVPYHSQTADSGEGSMNKGASLTLVHEDGEGDESMLEMPEP